MRVWSAERRQIVVLGGTTAGLYGELRPYLHGHPERLWLCLGVQIAVVTWMLVLLWRLRKNGCV